MSDARSPYADTRDMYTAHAMFRREFALLPGLVRSVPPKDTDRAQVVGGHIELVNLMLHHPRPAAHHRRDHRHALRRRRAGVKAQRRKGVKPPG
jgi:hypothetical protein